MKSLSLLGSTGSIGTQTLDIVRRCPNEFKIAALTTNTQIDLIKKQIEEFNPIAVCVMDENKQVIYKDEVLHTQEGFKELEKHLPANTVIAMESTGNYSKTLYNYLKDKYKVYYVDNVQMHNYAKLRYLHVKNDKVDARLIAEYIMADFKKITPYRVNELKDLCRLYHKAMKQLVRFKKSFQSQLSIIFPELEQAAYVKKGKGVFYLLLKYPTPADISAASTEDVFKALNEELQHNNFSMAHAEKIREVAKTSVGVAGYPVQCFQHTIRLILVNQKIVDSIVENLTVNLARTPYIKLLEKKGYGVVSLAVIVGEVGDIRRFSTHRKFVKYCGLDVSEKQSGKTTSIHCFITKQGNRYLRGMFYNLVLPQIADKGEFYEFYQRLKSKGKHTTTCMVAVSRKIAVRTYYDLLKCHC